MTPPNYHQGWLTPQLPQRQDSLEDQLRDMVTLANRAGCYDAADFIRRANKPIEIGDDMPYPRKELPPIQNVPLPGLETSGVGWPD